MKAIRFFLITTRIASFPSILIAATIHVPADQPTIQAGIDAAVDGDIVLEAPGTYVENIDFLGKAITLKSDVGPEVTSSMTRYIELFEPDFEPNDWDVPPEEWGGDLGTLEEDTTRLYGYIETTGFDEELGWYTGDTDWYGFDLPGEGHLDIDVQFRQACSESQAYNFWFLALGDQENMWMLDANFDYPDVELGLICPFIKYYFLGPDFLLNPISGETAVYFYVLLAGASGSPTYYTIDFTFDADPQQVHNIALIAHGKSRILGYLGLVIVPLLFVILWRHKVRAL